MSLWKLVRLQGSLGTHAADWDRLNERSFGNHPLLSSLIVEGLLSNFGDGVEYLCVLEVDRQVAGMCILRKQGSFAWASFLPAQAQIAPTMILDPASIPGLFQALPGFVLMIDLLSNDPAVGGVVDTAPEAAGWFDHALTMRVALNGTFEQYWDARPPSLRSNLRRYEMRVIASNISKRFLRISHPEHIPEALQRYAVLENAGWKGKRGTALSATPEQFRFYLELMQASAAAGDAVVYELWFDDTLVASRLLIIRNNMRAMLKTAYDERFATFAPGRLMLREAIEDGFATGNGGVIEFYTDANRSQLEWATDERWIQHVSVYRSRFARWFIDTLNLFRSRKGLTERRAIRVGTYDSPDTLPESARRLMAREEKRNMSFGFSWFQNLVATVYPEDRGVRFYTVEDAKSTRAVLPLRAAKIWMGWRVSALSNYYTSLYEPTLDSGVKVFEMAPLFSAIADEFPGVASMTFSPMDRASHGYRLLMASLRAKRWHCFEYFAFGNLYHPVTGCWADYLAGRSGQLRSTIKRMGKKFAADGGVLQLVRKEGEIADAIAAYESVYAKSWKNPEPFPAFMPGLLESCARKGTLRFGLACLNGVPIAAQVWIIANGRAEIYKLAYDEAYKQYSPGTLITAMLMEHVIDVDKVAEIDYLIGDDPYKEAWMGHRRERWGIVAYNPRSLRGLFGLLRELAGRLLKYCWARLRPATA